MELFVEMTCCDPLKPCNVFMFRMILVFEAGKTKILIVLTMALKAEIREDDAKLLKNIRN